MVVHFLNRRGQWEVHQRPDELPKSFVLCLLTGLWLCTQEGESIKPDIVEAKGDASFHLHWVRDDSIWTVNLGAIPPLRGAVREGWCVVTGEGFLVELPQPQGCARGPPAPRERLAVKDQWDRLFGSDLV